MQDYNKIRMKLRNTIAVGNWRQIARKWGCK